MQRIDRISAAVIDEAIRIHRELGPGLFESVYESILAGRLDASGLRIERQVTVPVEGCLVLEIKAVDQLSKAHERQLITYLRLMKQPVGLLLNFSGATMKEGIRRLVNNYRPD